MKLRLLFDLGFISVFVLLDDVCDYCYDEWQTSYVNNPSLYTSFLLFTRESGDNYTVVDVGDPPALYEGGFNSSLQTKILIHGWLDNGTNSFAEYLRNAYLQAQDVNIISVNWPGMSQSFYPLSRRAVIPVGRYSATFVDFLVTEIGLSPDSLHLVGHSLGAHIAGVAGKYVTFGNLTRISGLDPASPLFGTELDGRLNPTDAIVVDVIHTTGGYLGYYDPCGDVDFYPNGGVPIQPGCGIDIGFCSHRRAYSYFAESIASLGFISTACDSWTDFKDGLCDGNSTTIMGEHLDLRTTGTYYLITNPSSPFATWNSSFTKTHSDVI